MSTTTIFTKDDGGRRYRILNASDKIIREWSRKQYLTFEALHDNTTVSFVCAAAAAAKTISVSTDNGATWESKTSTEAGVTIATLNSGKKVLVKGDNTAYFSSNSYSHFASDKDVYVYGNMKSLTNGDNFISGQDQSNTQRMFCDTFRDMTTLRTNPKKGYIVMPHLTAGNWAYSETFRGCTGMTDPPIIDATTGGTYGLASMFRGCSSLRYLPEIKVKTVNGAYCFQQMFLDCVSLTDASGLTIDITTTQSAVCYSMFQNCTSLKKGAKLPMTTVTSGMYRSMYSGCTALEEASDLPALTIGTYCYESMYLGCKSLKHSPKISTTVSADYFCQQMFRNCTSLEEGPELYPLILSSNCYNQMFRGCSKLNKVTCLATDISATNCCQLWLNVTASVGTFVKNPFMSSWPTNESGIKSGWTVQDYPYIMTDWSNPEAMRVMYAKGFAASPEHMTKAEAEAVTSLQQVFASNSKLLTFDELRFFTGVDTSKVNSTDRSLFTAVCAYAVIPDNWTQVGLATLGGSATRRRIIYGSGIEKIGAYAFYLLANNSNAPCSVICKATTPPTIVDDNQGGLSSNYLTLYVPDNSVSTYQADSIWGRCPNILPISQCPADLLVYHDLLGGKLDITPYTT